MADITKYFSQWDSDNGGYKGLCVETSLKIAKYYYDNVEVPLTTIVVNGDGDGTNTTEAGAIKAANYLGLNPKPTNTFWKDINQADLKAWLGKGNLVVAFVMYNLIPAKYKQDDFAGLHAILLTAIVDDGSVRYCDPDFWGARREEGWMNNNKWISWADLAPAWKAAYKPYMGLQLDRVKETPPPPVDPCATQNAEIAEQKATILKLETAKNDLVKRLAETSVEIEKLKVFNSELSQAKSDLTIRVGDLQAELGTVQTKFTNYVEKMDREMEAAKRENTDLGVEVSQLTTKYKELEAHAAAQMAVAEGQIKERDITIANLTENEANLKSETTRLTQAILRLENQTLQAVSDNTLFQEFWRRLVKKILRRG